MVEAFGERGAWVAEACGLHRECAIACGCRRESLGGRPGGHAAGRPTPTTTRMQAPHATIQASNNVTLSHNSAGLDGSCVFVLGDMTALLLKVRNPIQSNPIQSNPIQSNPIYGGCMFVLGDVRALLLKVRERGSLAVPMRGPHKLTCACACARAHAHTHYLPTYVYTGHGQRRVQQCPGKRGRSGGPGRCHRRCPGRR